MKADVLDVAAPAGSQMPIGHQVWPPFRVQHSLPIVTYFSLAGLSSARAGGVYRCFVELPCVSLDACAVKLCRSICQCLGSDAEATMPAYQPPHVLCQFLLHEPPHTCARLFADTFSQWEQFNIVAEAYHQCTSHAGPSFTSRGKHHGAACVGCC
jgi:hypothetical protein